LICDFAIVITRNNQGTKAETAPPLHHLGATIDENDLFGRIAPRRWRLVRAAIRPSGIRMRHL